MAKGLWRALSGTPNNKEGICETTAGQTEAMSRPHLAPRCIVCGAIALTEKRQLVCHSDTYPRPRDYELFGILELERGWLLNEKSPRTFSRIPLRN